MPNLLYAITLCGLLVSGPLVDVVSASEPETLGQLEERLATLLATDAAQRVKRAVLELALERSRNASAVGLKAEAHALELDVRGGLARPAAKFPTCNPDADHLSILKPLLTKRDNPYLSAMVQAAREELAKPDTVWPRATAAKPTFSRLGGEYGVRSAGTTMREYFWLFAHSESPMRGDPELLKRALRRAHAYIDGPNLYAGYYAMGLGLGPMGEAFGIKVWIAILAELTEVAGGLWLVSDIGGPATRRVLPEGLPKQLWDNAVAKRGDVNIIDSNQFSWDNAIDRVLATEQYKQVRKKIEKDVCSSASGNESEIGISFHEDYKLAYAIGHATVNWKWVTIDPGPPPTRRVTITLADVYDFDKKHIWKKYEDQGHLKPFAVWMELESYDVEKCCP